MLQQSNILPEKVYEDKTKLIPSTRDDTINQDENKILSLRKAKNQKEHTNSILKNKLELLYEPKFTIKINELQTDNNDIRNFVIDLNKENTMISLKYLLTSTNENEVKFGILALRKFYVDIARKLCNENNIQCNDNNNYSMKFPLSKINDKIYENIFYNDIFIENNIIQILLNIIEKNIDKDYTNIYECLWIFINMSIFPMKNSENKFEYNQIFIEKNNLNIFIKMIKSAQCPQEILYNIFILLSNVSLNDNIIKNKLINSNLTEELFNYLFTHPKINSDVLLKFYRLLSCIYINSENLDIKAYKTIFKIFTLPLNTISSNEMINYCLSVLVSLSKISNSEIQDLFFKTLNKFSDLIFEREIKDNEATINDILDIFFNIIDAMTDNQQDNNFNIAFSILPEFYKKLIQKYKTENVMMRCKVENNILGSVNNLLFMNKQNMINYLSNEGKEIMNFCIDSSNSISSITRKIAMRFFLNFLLDSEMLVDGSIIYSIINSILSTLKINEFYNCYFYCVECILLIIHKSIKYKYQEDLKKYFNEKDLGTLLINYETYLMNNNFANINKEEDEENVFTIIHEINYFLNNTISNIDD